MFKKILLALAIIAAIVSCGNIFKATSSWDKIGTGDVEESYIDTLSRWQLDSLGSVDRISIDFNKDWNKVTGVDYETHVFLIKYLFIKSYADSTSIIYTLRTIDIPRDTLYIVEKRITYYQ